MTTAIILDKSFLQGSKKDRIHELAQSHRLLVSSVLFYELLTADEPGRSRCFSKFPSVENPVDLVDHVGTLIKLELASNHPAGKPSVHRKNIRFQFNPHLVSSEYELSEEGRRAVDERTAEHVSNGKKKGEGNTKNGNKYLAWAFVEAANFALRFCPEAKRFYERKIAKTNTVVAAKALAHKLARACFHILKARKPFDVTRCFA
jgi:hypothetical protein